MLVAKDHNAPSRARKRPDAGLWLTGLTVLLGLLLLMAAYGQQSYQTIPAGPHGFAPGTSRPGAMAQHWN